jgi:hypothetical protein
LREERVAVDLLAGEHKLVAQPLASLEDRGDGF